MKENEKKKKSGRAAKFLVMFLVFAGSAAMGLFIAKFIIDSMGEDFGLGEYYLRLALYLFVIYAAYFLQIIIHEGGHLVFGLLTGYRFSSFRIGSVILTKDGGKFRIGSFSMAGTGGQCLLYPPEEKDGKTPYVLYNLGGVIMNLAACAVSFALWLVLPNIPVLSVFLMGLFATL